MAGKALKSEQIAENGSSTKKFSERLKDIVDEIFLEANGLTCASCNYATFYPGGSGYCFKFVSPVTGEFLRTSKKAPACKRHPMFKEATLAPRDSD